MKDCKPQCDHFLSELYIIHRLKHYLLFLDRKYTVTNQNKSNDEKS